MKISKVGLSLMVVVFIASLSFSTAHAQGMGIWEGKWFKCTTKYSGYDTNESEATSRHSATEVGYTKILNVDETNKVINFLNYFYKLKLKNIRYKLLYYQILLIILINF